jgi:hypothetical protein
MNVSPYKIKRKCEKNEYIIRPFWEWLNGFFLQ